MRSTPVETRARRFILDRLDPRGARSKFTYSATVARFSVSKTSFARGVLRVGYNRPQRGPIPTDLPSIRLGWRWMAYWFMPVGYPDEIGCRGFYFANLAFGCWIRERMENFFWIILTLILDECSNYEYNIFGIVSKYDIVVGFDLRDINFWSFFFFFILQIESRSNIFRITGPGCVGV